MGSIQGCGLVESGVSGGHSSQKDGVGEKGEAKGKNSEGHGEVAHWRLGPHPCFFLSTSPRDGTHGYSLPYG